MKPPQYFTNQALEQQIKIWTAEYPHLLSALSIGASFEKRPTWLLTLTNQESGSDKAKPALWIDANIHATEITGTTAAMAVCQDLLTGYSQDERITRLLDTCTFYIVPRINPDGAKLAMADHPQYINYKALCRISTISS